MQLEDPLIRRDHKSVKPHSDGIKDKQTVCEQITGTRQTLHSLSGLKRPYDTHHSVENTRYGTRLRIVRGIITKKSTEISRTRHMRKYLA